MRPVPDTRTDADRLASRQARIEQTRAQMYRASPKIERPASSAHVANERRMS
jgi:hypothetical protein